MRDVIYACFGELLILTRGSMVWTDIRMLQEESRQHATGSADSTVHFSLTPEHSNKTAFKWRR